MVTTRMVDVFPLLIIETPSLEVASNRIFSSNYVFRILHSQTLAIISKNYALKVEKRVLTGIQLLLVRLNYQERHILTY